MPSHFSLNIKTLSANTNAMVLSMSLVHFNEMTTLKSMHVSLRTEEQAGRHVDTERLHWWFKEFSERAGIQYMPAEYLTPREAIKRLNRFIVDNGTAPDHPEVPVNFVWMRGTQFDWAILENLSHEFQIGLPFQHNAIRDQRTFCDEHVRHAPVKCRSARIDATYHADQIRRTLEITGQPLK